MPASIEMIRKALASDIFTPAEKTMIRWQYKIALSEFEEAIWRLLCLCDDNNLSRMSMAFPQQTAIYLDWTRGGMGQRIRAKGLPI